MGLEKRGFRKKNMGLYGIFLWDSYGILMLLLFVLFPALARPSRSFPANKTANKSGHTARLREQELVLYDIAVERPKVFGHNHVLRNRVGLDYVSHRTEVLGISGCWKKVRLRRRSALLAFGLCAEKQTQVPLCDTADA